MGKGLLTLNIGVFSHYRVLKKGVGVENYKQRIIDMKRKEELDIIIPVVKQRITSLAIRLEDVGKHFDVSYIPEIKRTVRDLENYKKEYKTLLKKPIK